MRLIKDFRLLENLDEMEQGWEAPKYHPDDFEDQTKSDKILRENPYSLVRFCQLKKRTVSLTFADVTGVNLRNL